jgi:nitrogen fixation/metabolism regulation signal transduction histidine kinase
MNIFRRKYFYLTLILLLIEIFIGVYVRDSFVRPFLGDVLVVILVYCFIQSFRKIQPVKAMAGVFVFACVV